MDKKVMEQLCTSEEAKNKEDKEYCLKVDYERNELKAPVFDIKTTGDPKKAQSPKDILEGQYLKTIKMNCKKSNKVSTLMITFPPSFV